MFSCYFIVGIDLLQLVNSQVPEIAIYLKDIHKYKPNHSGINHGLRTCSTLIIHEQTRIAATRLIWTVVILNSIEASGPLSNLWGLKVYGV